MSKSLILGLMSISIYCHQSRIHSTHHDSTPVLGIGRIKSGICDQGSANLNSQIKALLLSFVEQIQVVFIALVDMGVHAMRSFELAAARGHLRT